MPRQKTWTDDNLKEAVIISNSYRAVIKKLGLIPAGGNYVHVTRKIKELKLKTDHFTGKGWNIGWKFDPRTPTQTLELLLIDGSVTQSYTLKRRLFLAGIKVPKCEICGWAEESADGRIPVELDHINGKRDDNRLENLRILCPNCHSLQPTHRGKNKKVRYARVV